MPYSYHESTRLSQQNKLALKSLAATGELPKNHYWNALRARYDAHPNQVERANVVLGALLNRDLLQRQGILSASSPLFSNTGFFSYASNKQLLNMVRFDFYHPFLGGLFNLILPPSNPAGEGLNPPPTTPVTPITPVTPVTPPINPDPPVSPPINPDPPTLPPSGGGDGSGGTPGVPLPPVTPGAVPEPASAFMVSMAITVLLVMIHFKQRSRRLVEKALRHPAIA